MEAVGMNAFQMAASVGWDIYPIGKSTCPDEVPYGNRLGFVLNLLKPKQALMVAVLEPHKGSEGTSRKKLDKNWGCFVSYI